MAELPQQWRAPKRLTGYAARAFDQGFGRCLWFVDGGNVGLIPRTIAGFAAARQADLWSGLGLAVTYAGEATAEGLSHLRDSAGPCQPQLAQGSVFAAKARQRAGNLTGYTDLAAKTLCGLSAVEAAQLSDATLENLPADSSQPAYEIWRQRIQHHFQNQKQKLQPPQQV